MNRPASSGLRRRLRPLAVFASLMALVTILTMAFSLPPFGRPAHAALATPVGATDRTTGVPLWYQDLPVNGLQLQLCTDPPPPAAPGVCAAATAFEQFYWRAVAKMPIGNKNKATLTLATEAAYPNGVADGTQYVFDRLRVVVDGGLVPRATYKVTEPYGADNGVDTIIADSKGAIKYTEDFCLMGPCPFAPTGNPDRVGPWLTWTPVKSAPMGYIGNFALPHAVTGSPYGTNVFQVDGPKVGGGVISISTDQFQVSGQCAAGQPCPTIAAP
jgi:hypothetical protein